MSNEGKYSSIQEFFKDKNILITGASGFMGKLLLEKILRACPDVGTIYLLLRPKRGELPAKRVEKLLQEPVFDRLRKEKGTNYRPSVIAISGDISRPSLALSSHERSMLISNVSLVFHVAATVRFNEKLKTALQINLAGTHAILQLCKEMAQLKALVYVSTAYSNAPRTQVDEIVYDISTDPEKVLQCLEWMTEDQLEHLSPSLLGEWPNTYTYSKMLAETLVTKIASSLPVSIFRPAIVISTYKEPLAGWLDNLNGPAGITVGGLTGTIRCFQCDKDLKVDLVPVDMAANAMIATAWATARRRLGEITVYNFVSSAQRPITWREYQRICENYGLSHPPERAIWYYCLTITKNPTMFKFLSVIMHDLPARALDFIPAMLGRPGKMKKLYTKISQFIELMSYFTTREWKFSDTNVRSLFSSLDSQDQSIFPFDLTSLRWEPYLHSYMAGIRFYLLKELPENLPSARRKYFALYLLHRAFQISLAYGGYKLIMILVSYLLRFRKFTSFRSIPA